MQRHTESYGKQETALMLTTRVHSNHAGIIRLRSPTTRATHARTHEAARPDRAAAASRACTPPSIGRHAILASS
eukprot:6180485-Pleurochrysis_carterae.AAC.4